MRARTWIPISLLLLHAGCSDDPPTAPDPTYTVGGTVTGLEGTGLVLDNNFEDQLTVNGNGPFEFDADYEAGDVYSARVVTQPTGPAQTCTVTAGSGVIDSDDVTDIVVACGTHGENPDLDTGFDEDGRATGDMVDGIHDMALLDDGRIVVINERDVARFNADASGDASFGGGRFTIDFPGTSDRLSALAVQPDGKVVIVGGTLFNGIHHSALVRLNSDGSLDGSFGSGGMVTTDPAGESNDAYDVVVQPDGRIVTAGHVVAAGDSDFALRRYLPTGAVDVDFGTNGIATIDIGNTEIPNAVALQDDGRILIAGRVGQSGGAPQDIAIARFNSDGTVDTTFGNAGVAGTFTPDIRDEAIDIAVQPDGRIVLAGFLTMPGLLVPSEFLVMRLNADGSADNSFGSNSVAEKPAFGEEGDWAQALAIMDDGRIVVVGQKSNTTQPDFAVVRYNPDGTLDSTFGTNGTSAVDFFGDVDIARAVAITGDGGILVGGMAKEGNVTRNALAKLKP